MANESNHNGVNLYTDDSVVIDRLGRTHRRRSVEDRLWSRVDRTGGPDDCWEWEGYRTRKGYGTIAVRGNDNAQVHRVVLELKIGSRLPPNLLACHRCDNPPCCNPDHLYVGTAADNSADMVAKGRSPNPRNERSGRAKLSNAEVADIRARWSAGEPMTLLAADFGVHPSHVSRIVRGERRPQEAGP